jgi:hypothetical protein
MQNHYYSHIHLIDLLFPTIYDEKFYNMFIELAKSNNLSDVSFINKQNYSIVREEIIKFIATGIKGPEGQKYLYFLRELIIFSNPLEYVKYAYK